MENSDSKKALLSAVRTLTAQAKTRAQLKETLKRKGYEPHAIESALDELQRMGYLSDSAWAEGKIRSLTRRGYGAGRIRASLKQAGVTPDHIPKEALPTDEQQLQSISHLLKTRYAARDLTDLKERSRVAQSLIRRGFAWQHVQQLMEEN